MRINAKNYQRMQLSRNEADYVDNAAKVLYDFYVLTTGKSKSIEQWKMEVKSVLELKGRDGVHELIIGLEKTNCLVKDYIKLKEEEG